jgi:hypothetical protein
MLFEVVSTESMLEGKDEAASGVEDADSSRLD